MQGHFVGNISPVAWQPRNKRLASDISSGPAPPPPTHRPSQRFDQPAAASWWMASASGFQEVTDQVPTRAQSQRFDPLPELFSWWEPRPFKIQPSAATADTLPLPARSQRFDSLPDWSHSWYDPNVSLRILANPVPDEVPTHQQSQRFDPLPELFSWWEPQPPKVSADQASASELPLKNPSQRFDPLPVLEYAWYEPNTALRVISEPVRAPLPSQRFSPLPDYSALWWEVVPRHVLPPPADTVPIIQTRKYVAAIPKIDSIWWESRPPKILPPAPQVDSLYRPQSQRFTPLPDFNAVWFEVVLPRFTHAPGVIDDSILVIVTLSDSAIYASTLTDEPVYIVTNSTEP